jgi:uncharacterized membrane-anchored protein YhcB (DUF1043 family)
MEWFKSLSNNVKILIAIVIGTILAILFFKIKNNKIIKNNLQYELENLKKQMEVAQLEKEGKEKVKSIEDLKMKESELIEKIKYIENADMMGVEVTEAELESFFKSRGF